MSSRSSSGLSSAYKSCSFFAPARDCALSSLLRLSASSGWEPLGPLAASALSGASHPPRSLVTSAVPSFFLRILRGERDLLEICCSSVTQANQRVQQS
jgi:hypothetical protein